MDPTPQSQPQVAYVFGYASLVELAEPLIVGGLAVPPLPGQLQGFRRLWGAAMNNWEGGDAVKHFLDRETGERPRIRVAYLDIEERPGASVNGLAVPADAARLAALDAREINYARIDVSSAFQPALPHPVFTYMSTEGARARCQAGIAEANVYTSAEYLARVRGAFAALGPAALAQFDDTTEPPPFPERELQMILPS